MTGDVGPEMGKSAVLVTKVPRRAEHCALVTRRLAAQNQGMTANGIIKVAADGSPGSRRAYVWALSEAGRRRCAVELVTAFTGPSAQGG